MTRTEAAIARFANLWHGSDHGSIDYCMQEALKAYNELEPSAAEINAGTKALFELPAEGQNTNMVACILRAAQQVRE